MSTILQYFGKSSDCSKMPDSRGPLSRTMPSSAISSANREVRQLTAANKTKRGSYYKYSPKERADIGKYALENGVQAARRKFGQKLKKDINESTVRSFKNQYKQVKRVAAQTEDGDEPISELPVQKRGRKLLLGDELDLMVQRYIADTRRLGGSISTEIVKAGAKGILLNQDRTMLAEFGGPATLSKAWAVSLLKRMNFSKRRCTTKSSMPPENFLQEKSKFLQEVVDVVKMEDIPAELIFNWDQTGLNLVPASQWTMAPKGSKRIEMKGLNDKRQITAVFCGTLLGDFLPIQLIYTGKTDRCHAQYSFPSDWHVTHSENHWSNESTMLAYIKEIIIPYVEQVRDKLNVNESQSALAIFDHFKGQLTENVVQLLEDHNIQQVLVPPSCTDRLQPLDISVNRSAKSFLKTEFQRWYSEQIAQQLSQSDGDIDKIVPIDLSTARLKCISAQWIERMCDHLGASPDIIINGFKDITASISAGKPVLDEISSVDLEDSDTNSSDEDSTSAGFSSNDEC